MKRISLRSVLALTFLAGLVARPAHADPIVAGTTLLPGAAIQDITLLPGTPFNPGNTEVVISGVTGYGTLVLQRGAQVGDTIPILALSGGQYYGVNPALGGYVFGNILPLTGADFTATLTNVVQDPTDPGFATGDPSSFESGDFTLGGDSFGFEFTSPGPLQGVKLFTSPLTPFLFTSTFDGLPPSEGTVLNNAGLDAVDVLFNGVVVARSTNRRIVLLQSVPEPSGLVFAALGAAGLLGWTRRRRVG